MLEKSWFSRGTLLRIQGVRNGENFIPKKSTKYNHSVIEKILIDSENKITLQKERALVEE